MVNLRPALEATRADWEARLGELFGRMHFILGEQVDAFEREFAAHHGARHCVGVGTGTAALELCLRAAGVQGEVIVPALTSPFTAQAVLAAGCRPRFADVEEDSLLLDVEDAARRVTRRTAAILPVHLYGQPYGPGAGRLARAGKLAVIHDACQAHGAPFPRPLAAYSFYPTKNLGCLGDGGAVLTNSLPLALRLRLLRDGGRKGGQVARIPAINSRLDEMQACYLRAFLPHLGEWNAWRGRIASLYDEALRDCPGVRLLRRRPGSVNHLYVIRAARRGRLRAFLARGGIQTAIHYDTPLHLHPAFRAAGQKRGDCPRAERACREILSLPLWPYMKDEEARAVASAIRQFYGA